MSMRVGWLPGMPRDDHFQDLTIEGNIAMSDTSRVTTDLIPFNDATEDLGSSTRRWRNIYASESIAGAVPTSRTISTTSPLGGGGALTGDLTLTCTTCATSSNNLSFFATTTSAQLASLISDETGSGTLVFATSPSLVTPSLGVATATSLQGIIGNVTPAAGTFTTLTANTSLVVNGGTALTTTNQTGTGSLVLATSPTLVTPVLGVATGTSFQGIIGNVTPAAGSFTALNATVSTTSPFFLTTGTVADVGDFRATNATTILGAKNNAGTLDLPVIGTTTGDRVTLGGTNVTAIQFTNPLVSAAADPADTGVIRLGNTEEICWESDVAGTDVCLAADASEVVSVTGGTLNANTLLTGTWAIPGTIGSTTPNTGAFTTISATNDISFTAAGNRILAFSAASNPARTLLVQAGSGTGAGVAGAALSLRGGNAGDASTAVGGVTITPGTGTGQPGTINIGTANTTTINIGMTGATQSTTSLHRFAVAGTALVAGDFALDANWGVGAAVSAVTGTDQAWQITVTAAGIPGLNPTITLTFTDGTFTNAPICITKMTGGTGVVTDLTETPTATTNVITFNGTPVAVSTYIISSIVVGR